MKRSCKVCGLEQEVEDFPIASVVKGKTYYRHLCTTCYHASKEPRKRKIKEEYYALKKQYVCEECGEDDYRVLEFDHKDRSKKSFSVADGVRKGFGIDKIKKEMEKCRVLCANCHRIKTWNTFWKCA